MKFWLLRHRSDLIAWMALGAVIGILFTCGLIQRTNDRDELDKLFAPLDAETEYAKDYAVEETGGEWWSEGWEEYWEELTSMEYRNQEVHRCSSYDGAEGEGCHAMTLLVLQAGIKELQQ